MDDVESIVDMVATALRFAGYHAATEIAGFDVWGPSRPRRRISVRSGVAIEAPGL